MLRKHATYRPGKNGAGEGNRTLVFSLGSCCSTIELHPRAAVPSAWRADRAGRRAAQAAKRKAGVCRAGFGLRRGRGPSEVSQGCGANNTPRFAGAAEQTMVVAFQRHTPPRDDCLHALRLSIPHLPRSALHRSGMATKTRRPRFDMLHATCKVWVKEVGR